MGISPLECMLGSIICIPHKRIIKILVRKQVPFSGQMCAELTLLGRVGGLVDDDAESQRRREGVELVGQQ